MRSSLETLSNPLTQAIWGVTPPKAREDYAEQARLVEYNLTKVVSLDRYLRHAVKILKHGFELFELTTDVREIPAELFPLHPSPERNGKKQALMITGIAPRLPRTVKRWIFDENNAERISAIEQWVPTDDQTRGFNGTQSIADRLRPKPKRTGGYRRLDFSRADGTPAVIRHTYDQEGNDPEGLARSRSIYFEWKSKRALRILEAIRHERQNLGVPMISLPTGFNKDDETKAKLILEALRGHERAYIVLPNGFTFQWNTSGTGQGTNVQEAIDYCDRNIWMNVHAPFMLLGGNGDTGSYALSDTINDVRLLALEGLMKLICEPWNVGVDTAAIIPWLVAQNYGEQIEYPTLGATNLPTRDWQKITPNVLDAITAGAITADDPLEDHLRQVNFLPKRDPKTARERVQTSAPGKLSDKKKVEEKALA